MLSNALFVLGLLIAAVTFCFWWDSSNDLDFTHAKWRFDDNYYLEFTSAQDVLVLRIVEQRRLDWAKWGLTWMHVNDDGDLERYSAWSDATENGIYFLGFGVWFKQSYPAVWFGISVPHLLVIGACLLPAWTRWRRSNTCTAWRMRYAT